MKIYKTQSEVEADIEDGVLAIDGDVRFECSISIEAHITAENINAKDITAKDINAKDINAWNITAENINAENISYHAFCCVYKGIKCTSIKARRNPSHAPICLEGKLEIIEKEISLAGKEVDVIVDGKTYKAIIK